MLFTVNKDINNQKIENITGKLLYIKLVKYLDYEILKLPNHKVMFYPIEREGYDFFITDSNIDNANIRVKIRTFNIYHNNFKVTRCKIDIIKGFEIKEFLTSPDEANYVPTHESKTTIKMDFENEDGLYKYNIYLEDEYLGFVSEFGETKHYSRKGNGLLFLPLDEAKNIIKVSNSEKNLFNNNFEYFERLSKETFPTYKGSFKSIFNARVVGVSNKSQNDFLIYLPTEKCYNYIKLASQNVLQRTGCPYEIYTITEDSVIDDGINPIEIKYPFFNCGFERKGRLYNKTVDIVRGIGIKPVGCESADVVSLYTCLLANKKIEYFHERIK